MKIIGVICEYNPFHNGHLYHLKKIKEDYKADIIIAIITGYFTMRGDISVLNIYAKTKLALANGVDIVIENPYLLATNNADVFSYYSILLLDKMGVNEIVSGSETNDISYIEKLLDMEDNATFQSQIKANLSKGYSYRKSYSLALEENKIQDVLANDLLNVKYLKAIKAINPNIKLSLIKRVMNNYLDLDINDSNIQSAKAIRNLKEIKDYVPKEVNEIFKAKGFYQYDKFIPILKHQIITGNLSQIMQATEGIDKLFDTSFKSIEELTARLSSKRFTATRILRFISYIITNTTTSDLIARDNPITRVIGFNENGQKYLNLIKKERTYFTRLRKGISPLYDKELMIAKIFSNVYEEDFIKLEQALPIKN